MLGPAPHERPKTISNAEQQEVSGVIGELTPEQAAEIRRRIDEKTKELRGMRLLWKDAFEKFKQLKADADRSKALLERRKISGGMRISEAEDKEGERAERARVEDAGRDAQRYMHDARELEQEIEALKATLNDRGN